MASSTSPKTIDLNCPSCEALLELDRGFAGGVCRCSTCGTLMTVPKLSSEKAEKLVRAERPGEAPASGAREGTRDREGRPARPERPERPERPGRAEPSSKTSFTRNATPVAREGREDEVSRDAEAGGEEWYRTASGREVRVDARRVPMAETKRKAIRAATVVVFVAVIGGVLGLCGLAAYLLVTQPTAEEIAAARYVETFTYDASANPYAIEAPNLLGFPLANRVAMVIDSSGMSAEAWEVIRRSALAGVDRDAGGVLVTVVALERQDVSMPLNQSPMGAGRAAVLGQALEQIVPTEVTATLESGVASALRVRPQVVIVVTGRELSVESGRAMDALIPEDGVRLDVLLIDADSFALEDVARRTGGHFATLEAGIDLVNWKPVE